MDCRKTIKFNLGDASHYNSAKSIIERTYNNISNSSYSVIGMSYQGKKLLLQEWERVISVSKGKTKVQLEIPKSGELNMIAKYKVTIYIQVRSKYMRISHIINDVQ